MTCSSSRTWAYMSMNIPGSPGNSKGGAGWRNCQSWFCAVRQACHAIGSPSVRSSSFISSPADLELHTPVGPCLLPLLSNINRSLRLVHPRWVGSSIAIPIQSQNLVPEADGFRFLGGRGCAATRAKPLLGRFLSPVLVALYRDDECSSS